ncbi:MAG: hypothetical protein B6U97_00360 [Candidatus Altiarchaeales archaeon ex4484_96]|nr:MAG: hypothetical protein B6U97_00360 [Candidatus Altiarchaeales archaeon ex4484_96]
MIDIIIDTNFFMISHKNKIDIINALNELVSERHEIITFTGVLKELKSISNASRGVDGVAARVALELIEKKDFKLLESIGNVDDYIIKYVDLNKDKKIMVCTADAMLKKSLRDRGVDIICMRSGKNLGLC